GRREGLKIPWPQGRAGSIPAPGTWSAESAPTRNARPEEPQQHGCVADFTIAGGVHERHAPAPASLCQRIERLLRGGIRELTLVALLELDPFCGIMLVPLAQRVRRRDALLPGIQPGILLFHSPRPESLDQNAISIRRLCRLIGPLHHDHTASLDAARVRRLAGSHRRRTGAPRRRSPLGNRGHVHSTIRDGRGKPGVPRHRGWY